MPPWLGFIGRVAIALGLGGRSKEKRRGVLRTAAVIFGLMKEYKVDSIQRIEEAIVKEVEAESLEAQAEAVTRVAEAAEKQAMVACKLAEAELTRAKADATRSDSKAKQIKGIADAAAKLADAASKLKRAGGSVTLIEEEIVSLIHLGTQEFPSDPLIADAASDIREPEREES